MHRAFAPVALITITMLIATLCSSPSLAQDIEGSQDHPMVSRYPGQQIGGYRIENYMPYKVPAGPVTGYRTISEWIETEGRVTRIFYKYVGTARTHDEIWKNYSDGLKAAGFEIIAKGSPKTRRGNQQVGGRTWQGVVFAANPWNEPNADVYTLTAGTSSQGGSAAIILRGRPH